MRIVLQAGALYKARRDADISRDELSRRLSVSTATTYRIEKGTSDPSPRFIAELMHFTGKPFEELFEIVRQEAA